MPTSKTIIAQPLVELDPKERKEKLSRFKTIKDKVSVVLNNKDEVLKIVDKFGSSENESAKDYEKNLKKRIEEMCVVANFRTKGSDMTEAKYRLKAREEYEEALRFTDKGYKLYQKRDVTEIFINSYNVEWIRAWNGNIDVQVCKNMLYFILLFSLMTFLQVCLDYYEVIKYIIDYLLKDDVALKEAIEAGLKLASPEEKERMKTVASLFLSHRQIGESEAIFKLLPNLHLKHSTVAVVWVATGKNSETSNRWRLATKEQIDKGYDVQKLKDKEGLWIETQDMLKKYLRRPTELEDMELAHFCKMYKSAGQDKIPEKDTQGYFRPVSYTHLKLPTILRV